MKLFCQFQVVLFLSVLYSTTAEDPRQKRQTSLEDVKRCWAVNARAHCESGLYQASTDLTLRCGELTNAVTFLNGCQRNARGDYCALTAAYMSEVNTINSTCQSSVTGNCTSECRNLLMTVRVGLGCCVNSVFNESTHRLEFDTLNSLYKPDEFSYALWSNCGVEPVTEECTASTVVVRRNEISPNASCNYAAENGRLQCNRTFLDPIVAALRNAGGCEAFVNGNMEQCGVHESGDRCSMLTPQVGTHFVAAIRTCINDTCHDSCRQALMNLRDNGGCCVNTLWNNSLTPISLQQVTGQASGFPFLRYEFWTTNCGLETLELCNTMFIGGGAAYLKASGVITLLLIAVASLAF